MSGLTQIQFIHGLAIHLKNLYDFLQRPIGEQEIQQKISQEDLQMKQSLDFDIDSIDMNSLNTQITQCKKQKLIKQHELINRPKKPISSFVFYFREQLKKKDHPSNEREVGKLAKIISYEWKDLPAEQKEPYYQKSMESKRVYREQMKNFNSQHAEELQQIQKLKRMTNNKMRKLKRQKNLRMFEKNKDKKSKQAQIENAIGLKKPKIPLSNFFIFFQENSQRLSEVHKENRRSKLVQIASEEWKKMSSKQKERYDQLAKKYKNIYDKELEEYAQLSNDIIKVKSQLPQAPKTNQDYLSEDSLNQSQRQNSLKHQELTDQSFSKKNNSLKREDSFRDSDEQSSTSEIKDDLSSSQSYNEDSPIKQPEIVKIDPPKQSPIISKPVASEQKPRRKPRRGKKKVTNCPKGPVSSFFLYYNCIVRQLKKEYPDLKGSELVKIASERWAQFPESEKQIYQQQAKRARELYSQQMVEFKKDFPQEASKMKYFKNKKDKSS